MKTLVIEIEAVITDKEAKHLAEKGIKQIDGKLMFGEIKARSAKIKSVYLK